MKLKDLLENDYALHKAKLNKWGLVPLYGESTGIEGITIHASMTDDIHPIRIKASLNDTVRIAESVTILVENGKVIGPKLLSKEQTEDVVAWIKFNEAILRQYWDDGDSCGFVTRVKPINKKVAKHFAEIRKENYRILMETPLLQDYITGIAGVSLYVDQREGLKHAPRVKASLGNSFNPQRNVSFSILPINGMHRMTQNIGLSTTQEKQIVQWLTINRQLLLQYVNKLITLLELQNNAIPIPVTRKKDIKKFGMRKKKIIK